MFTRVRARGHAVALPPLVSRVGFPIIFLTVAGSTAVAADADSTGVSQTVVVTATRSEISLTQVPESVSVVSAEQIQRTPGKSLDDILRTVPSVNTPIAASYQLHPTADSISMRGLGGTRALVLLDGVPLNDPFFGYVQWNLVPLDDVQRVEVVRGGGATLWGNYAMGGVINVITRVPDREELDLDAGGGSYGTYRANGHLSFPVSDHIRTGIDATANGTSGYQAVDAAIRAPLDVPTAFQARNVQMTTQFDLDSSLTGSLRAGYHDNHQTLYTPLSTNAQREWNFSGDLTKTVGASSLTGTLYRTDSNFRTDNTDTPPGALPGVAEFVQNRHFTPVDATGASLLWSLKNRWRLRQLSAGVDYQQIHGADIADIFDATGAQIRTDVGRGAQRFAGAFLQADAVPVEALEILASGRYQYFQNYDGFDGSPGGRGRVPNESSSSFDPRLSARYSLTRQFALRAAGYKAFRAPTLDNLYRTFSTPLGIFYGNADLKPERLTGGEAGFDITLPAVRAQVTYYRNDIDDLITTRNLAFSELPSGFFFGSRGINAGSARAQGAESEVDWFVSERLQAVFAYAYADSTIRANPLDPASVGRQLGGVPRQTASATLAYTDKPGLSLATRLRWLEKSYADNDQTLPVDGHFVVDLSVSYSFRQRFEPYLQIENLFDRHYVADNSGFSAPQLGTPFTVFAGLRARLD